MTSQWNRRTLLIAAGAAALAGTPLFRAKAADSLYRWRGTVLGGTAQMYLDAGSAGRGDRLVQACLDEIRRLERIFSLHRPDSALSRLNAAGRLSPVPPELTELLSLSRHLWAASEGAFDPSVQPLWQAFANDAGTAEMALASSRVGFDGVTLSDNGIAFARDGMALTLNGIAQGYITDRVTALLRGEGLDHTLVQLGETRALGPRPDGRPWSVSLGALKGPLSRTVEIDNTALAVSSAQAGPMPGRLGRDHLLNPATGSTVTTPVTVAVRAGSAALADGLSTALAVVPPEARSMLADRFPTARAEVF